MLNPLSILGFGLAQARIGFVCAAVIAGSSYTRVPCCGQNFVCVCVRETGFFGGLDQVIYVYNPVSSCLIFFNIDSED